MHAYVMQDWDQLSLLVVLKRVTLDNMKLEIVDFIIDIADLIS